MEKTCIGRCQKAGIYLSIEIDLFLDSISEVSVAGSHKVGQ